MWTGECWRHFTEPGEPNPGIDVLDMMLLLYFGEARQRTVDKYSELFRS